MRYMKEIDEIWCECLDEVMKCHEDSLGNRPCDNGASCDACLHNRELDGLFKAKLKKHGIEI